MSKPHRIAVLCSDSHLTLLQPTCRSDTDWMEVQVGYLNQLKTISGGMPIVFAGDLFDRWNVQPELINFALKHLPDGMICVPGQHDLPNHRLDQMHRSGYGVLVEAGKIVDISGNSICRDDSNLMCHGFGWGQEITPMKEDDSYLHIAVIHRYCWAPGKSYPGAPEENHFSAFKKQLKGYDAAVFGDNHSGFQATTGDCNLINTGTFIRRKSDEMNYRPRVGILYSDGSIKSKFLDTTTDRFHQTESPREEIPINMREFIEGLEELGEHGLNFREAVENHLRTEEMDDKTKQIILTSLDA